MNIARNRRVALSVTVRRSPMQQSCVTCISRPFQFYDNAVYLFDTLQDSCGDALLGAPKSHQCVHAERLDLAPFNQLSAAMRPRPGGKTLKRKFRPQAEPVRLLRDQPFDSGRKTPLGVEMINQNNLTARPQHPHTFRQDPPPTLYQPN